MLSTLVLILLWPLVVIAGTKENRAYTIDEQQYLLELLADAGLESAQIEQLKLSERRCYPGALKINLHHKDKPEYYDRFKEATVVKDLKTFLKSNGELLEKQQQRYGVPAEVVGAILMIESRLGKNRGKWPVADLLLSLQLMPRDPVIQSNMETAVRIEEEEGGTRSAGELEIKIRKRAARRSKWARKELISFMQQFPEQQWTLRKGSWAGALGNCQFIPSSRESYAVDGDGDGVINLDSMPDAIFSIGNYLARHGWKKAKDLKGRRTAIRKYNHSDAYVSAVLGLAQSAQIP